MIYFFDGTINGFLTSFLLAFSDKEAVLSSMQCQLALGQKTLSVQTDQQRAMRAAHRLHGLDKNCLHELGILLRCSEPNRDQIAFEYLRLIATKKHPVRKMLAENAVIAASDCLWKVNHEVERFRGYVRFIESASGALYAPISPDHDICDLLAPHFRARIPLFPFVIHDVNRKKAAVYDGINVFCAPLESADIVLAADEENWQKLWQTYFQKVNIPERERLKQQRAYLPVRYRKFMPEFQ